MSSERRFAFHGRGGAVFGIYAVTLLLSVLTLGIHYPWGKAKLERYFYSQTDFGGDRFAYHGTGKELLLGWIKVVAVLGILYGGLVAIGLALRDDDPLQIALSVVMGLAGWAIVPVALVGSQRYRLSRSSWRGIRFSFRGTLKAFFPEFVKGSLLTALTLGLYLPIFQNAVRKQLVNQSHFGNLRFTYDGDGGLLFRRFLRAVILTPFTLGLIWYWYRAERDRYYWSRTSIAGATFRYELTGIDLLMMTLSTGVVLTFTLGIAYPWIRAWTLEYKLRRLAVDGDLDLESVVQDALSGSATGEELADFVGEGLFDIELAL